jgi:hypothetical protein
MIYVNFFVYMCACRVSCTRKYICIYICTHKFVHVDIQICVLCLYWNNIHGIDTWAPWWQWGKSYLNLSFSMPHRDMNVFKYISIFMYTFIHLDKHIYINIQMNLIYICIFLYIRIGDYYSTWSALRKR